MKKILQIGPSTSLAKGGMSRVIEDLENSAYLRSRYHMKSLASYADGLFFRRCLYSFFSYLRFREIYSAYDLFHIHLATRGSFWRKRLYLRFLKKQGKKVILHIHGAEFKVYYRRLSARNKVRLQETLVMADGVIVLSKSWYDFFRKIAPEARLLVVENAVDTDVYSYEEKSSDHYNKFLFLGILCERKGAFDLVEAMERAVRKNPLLHLTMAGDGEIENIRQLIRKKKLEDFVTVLDWVDEKDKLLLLKDHGTLILPSYNEGLPMAILEAMASGLVIISTRVGGIPEILGEENGCLLEAGDVASMASALLDVAQKPEEGQKKSKKNRELALACFNLEAMHRKIGALYEVLLESENE